MKPLHLMNIEGSGGGKSGGGGGESPNTLKSEAIAKILDLVCSGQIFGFVNAADPLKSIYYNKLPIKNSDDSFNFNGAQIEYVLGTMDQDPILGFDSVEATEEVGVEATYSIYPSAVITDDLTDELICSVSIPALTKQNTESGSLEGNWVSFEWQVKGADEGTWTTVAYDSVQEKFTSVNVFDYYVDISGRTFPVSVRLKRITQDSTEVGDQRSTFFATYTTIINKKFSYPGSALIAHTLPARQFGGSIPDRGAEIYGQLCLIPSNYNPWTRVYDGIWDGTFVEGWTNNPAFVLLSCLVNTDWGLGEYISLADIDKNSLYAIGQYCDELVPDGFGGTEPRYTFNAYIQTQENAATVIQSISSQFHGMTLAATSKILFSQDAPSDPVALVTNANVLGGEFNYEGIGATSRKSAYMVEWNNPDKLYEKDFEFVEDPELIATFGWKMERLPLLGCTSRGQARRAGRWQIFTNKFQTRMVSYRASLDHGFLLPGNIIRLADNKQSTYRYGGRVISATTTSITLDAATTLESGKTYTIYWVNPSGTISSATVTNGASTTSTITFSAVSAGLVPAAESIFLIASTEEKLYRVLALREVGGREPYVEVMCAQHFEDKYDLIEGTDALEATPSFSINSAVPISPPSAAVLEKATTYLAGVPKTDLQLSFAPSTSPRAQYYTVLYRHNFGVWQKKDTFTTTVNLPWEGTGRYQLSITAKGMGDQNEIVSTPLTYETVVEDVRALDKPTVETFVLENGLTSTTFGGGTAKFRWSVGVPPNYTAVFWEDPYFRDFEIEVRTTGNVSKGLYYTRNPFFEYTSERNSEANAGVPLRNFKVRVRIRDTFGSEDASDWVELSVSNPAPAVPTGVTVTGVTGGLRVKMDPPSDLDWKGTLVWTSTSPGISLASAPTDVGKTTAFTLEGTAGSPLYYRFAFYDEFGKDSPNATTEASLTIPVIALDDISDLNDLIVPTDHLSGTIVEAQIATGAVTNTKIGALAVDTAKIANDAITNDKIGPLAVGTAEIAGSAITTAKIAALAVDAAALASSAVTTAKIANGAVDTARLADDAVTNAKIGPLAVSATEIAAGAVIAGKIGAAAVTATEIAAAAVGTTQLGPSAVTTAKIAAAAITATELAAAAVTTAKIAASAVTATELANSAVTTAKIAAAAVTANEIGAAAVVAGKIAASAVSSTELAAGAVIAGKIGASAVTATELATAAVTTAKIAAAAITATEIASAAVTTAKIATGAVTSNELGTAAVIGSKIAALAVDNAAIAAAAVTGAKIAANTITAANIQAGTITANEIAAGTITATQIAARSITTSKLVMTEFANLTADPYGQLSTEWNYTGTIPLWNQTTTHATAPAEVRLQAASSGLLTLTPIPAVNGDVFRVSMDTRSSADANADLNLTVWSYDKNDAFLASHVVAVSNIGTSWAKRSANVTVANASCAYVRIGVFVTSLASGYVSVTDMMFAKSNAAELIVDGSITASHIAANTITASQIAANTITAGQIAANTITAGQIAAGTITATQIAAGTITATQIAANTITASKLLVVDTQNMLLDPYITDTSYWGQNIGTIDSSTDVTTTMNLPAAFKSDVGNGTTSQASSLFGQPNPNYRPTVEPGKPYRLNARTLVKSGFTGRVTLRVYFYALDNATIVGTLDVNSTDFRTVAAVGDQVIEIDGIVTAPATAVRARPNALVTWSTTLNNAGSAYLGNMRMMRANNGELIVDGTITAAKILANTITAGQIAAGTLTATEIAAGAIVASKLYVTDFSNMVLDTNFNDTTQWTLTSGWAFDTSTDITSTLAAPKGVKLTATGANPQTTSNLIFGNSVRYLSVEPSKSYRISFRTLTKTGFNGYLQLVVNWYDQAGTFISGAAVALGTDFRFSPAGSNVVSALDGIVTSLSTAAFMGFYITNSWPAASPSAGVACAAAPRVHRAASGELIVDGAITAAKIQAGTITSNEIAANTITAGDIAAGTITATQIAANTITAGQIAAGTITATEIAASTITAAKIAAGTITGSLIAAETITASKLVLTSPWNMAPDSGFSDAFGNSTGIPWRTSSTIITRTTGDALNTSLAAEVIAKWVGPGTAQPAVRWDILESTFKRSVVEPGKPYHLQLEHAVTSGFNGAVFFDVQWLTSAGAHISYSSVGNVSSYWSSPAGGTVTGSFSAIVTAPATAATCNIRMYVDWNTDFATRNKAGTCAMARPTMRRAANAELIVDGTITASKIATDTITANQIAADAITANEIAANTITAAEIAAGTITATEIAGSTITAAKIAANTITSGQIAANTIVASRLLLQDFNNLCEDPFGTNSSVWTALSSATLNVATASVPQGRAIQITAFGGYAHNSVAKIPAKNGDKFRVSYTAWLTAGSGSARLWLRHLDSNASTISGDLSTSAQALTTTPTRYTGVITLNQANTAFINYYIANAISLSGGNMMVTDIYISRMNAAELVVDGTITASHILAGTITANEIAGNTITAAKIQAGTITATEIAGSTITGAKIAAGTITAGLIAADAIVATKIIAADLTNLIRDSELLDSAYWQSSGTSAWTFGSTDNPEVTTTLGATRAWKTPVGDGTTTDGFNIAQLTSTTQITVEPGKTYRMTMRVLAKSGNTYQYYMQMNWFKRDGSTAASTATSSVTNGSADFRTVAAVGDQVVSFDGQVTAPSDAAFGRLLLIARKSTTLANAQHGYIANVRIHRAASSELIVDGAITAAKILAGTITATQIAAGTITAANIAAGAITASKLVVSDLTNLFPDAPVSDSAAYTTIPTGVTLSSPSNLGFRSAGCWLYNDATASAAGSGYTGGLTGQRFAVDPNRTYWGEAQHYAAGAGTSGFWSRIQWYDYAGVALAGAEGAGWATIASSTVLTATGFTNYSNAVTPPSGARFGALIHYFERTASTRDFSLGGFSLRVRNNADLIVDGTITAAKIVAATITSNEIAANTITAAKIAANTITASRLVLTDTSNMLNDAEWAEGLGASPIPWTVIGGSVSIVTSDTLVTALNAVRVAKITGAGTSQPGVRYDYIGTPNSLVPIEPSKTYGCSVDLAVTSGFNGFLYADIEWRDRTGAVISYSTVGSQNYLSSPAGGTVTHSFNGIVTAPATGAFASFRPIVDWSSDYATRNKGGTAGFTRPRMRKAASSDLIVDGAITAAKILAGTITADRIGAGQITANEIAAGTITASRLVVADSANLLRDPDLLDANSWNLSSGWVFGTTEAPEVTTELVVPRAIRSALGNGTTSQGSTTADSSFFPVLPTAYYRIAAKINNRSGFTGQTRIGIEWYDRAQAYISADWVYGNNYKTVAASTSVIQTLASQFDAPATAYYAKFRCYVDWSTTLTNASRAYFGALRAQRAVNADLIVDGAITAAKLKAGDVTADRLVVNAGMFVGSGSDLWAVALQPKNYLKSDGETVSFGIDFGTAADVSWDLSGLPTPAAGERYDAKVTSSTGTGFTCYLKKITSGGYTTYTQTTDSAGGGGDPTRIANAAHADNSASGNYTFRVIGDVYLVEANIPGPKGSTTTWVGSNSIEVYFYTGSSWALADTYTFEVTGGGVGLVAFDLEFVVNYTGAVADTGKAYGVTLTDTSNGQSVDDLHTVSYQAEAQSSVTSVTTKVTWKVQPKSAA